MPRAAAPPWRQRMEPITDDWILASVQRAGGMGRHHPETGKYAELVITGLDSREQAAEYRRSLHRCALWLLRNRGYDIGMSSDPPARQPDGSWAVAFRATDKTFSRNYVLQRYGSDRSRWPYDPRRRGQAT